MEVEAKFRIPDEQTFQNLLATPSLAGYTLESEEVKQVVDEYRDTPDRAFLRDGFAFRLRSTGDRRLISLKSLTPTTSALHRREEMEAHLDPELVTDVDSWPTSGAKALILEIGGKQPFQKLISLKQERHIRILCSPDNQQPVIELSLDRINLEGSPEFFELEAELLPAGQMSDVDRVIDVLENEWQLQPETLSKFERGLGLTHPDLLGLVARLGRDPARSLETPGILPGDPMAEAVRKILRVQFDVMVANEAGSREGADIESVHDMRVATRRMRAAFRLFGSYFQAKAIGSFQKDLRKTGRTLGAVRDLDVFNRDAQKYLKKLDEQRRHELDPLLDHWYDQREKERQKLIAYLNSGRYRRFKNKFGRFLMSPGEGVDPISMEGVDRYQVRHVLSSCVWQLYETVRAYETVLDDASVSTLHRLRIDCKRLRYTLEFFQEVLGPDTAQLIKDVVAVQDHLGDLQDAHVASQLLTDFLKSRGQAGPSSGHPPHQDLSGIAAYLAYRQDEAAHLIATFPQDWPTINSLNFRRRLAATLLAL